MPYLIDGSNLGGALAGAKGARNRSAVVDWLLPWARRRGRVELVFDGPEEGGLARAYGALRLRYSGARTADAVIREIARRRPVDWWVVTDDRRLAEACRDLGARTLSVAELSRRVEAAGAPPDPGPGAAEPEVDVEDWQAYFRGEKE